MLKPKKRITKKELKQDEFLEFLYKAERFIRQHSKILTYVSLGIVVVVVLGVMMYNSRQNAEMQAATELGAAQQLYDQEQYQQAIDQLESVVTIFQGTNSAGVAVFFIASAYDRLGNSEEAASYYEQYLDRYDDDPLLSTSALASLGAIRAAEGNYQEAQDLYRRAIRRAPHRFLAQQYTVDAAEAAFGAGNASNARTMVSTLLENDDLGTQVRTDAQELLGMIDVQTGM